MASILSRGDKLIEFVRKYNRHAVSCGTCNMQHTNLRHTRFIASGEKESMFSVTWLTNQSLEICMSNAKTACIYLHAIMFPELTKFSRKKSYKLTRSLCWKQFLGSCITDYIKQSLEIKSQWAAFIYNLHWHRLKILWHNHIAFDMASFCFCLLRSLVSYGVVKCNTRIHWDWTNQDPWKLCLIIYKNKLR